MAKKQISWSPTERKYITEDDSLYENLYNDSDNNDNIDNDTDNDSLNTLIDTLIKEENNKYCSLSVNELINDLKEKELSHLQIDNDILNIISNNDSTENEESTSLKKGNESDKDVEKEVEKEVEKAAESAKKEKIFLNIKPIHVPPNRINAQTANWFVNKRSFHDQYLLDKAWFFLGNKILAEEISLPLNLFENPNIIYSKESEKEKEQELDIDYIKNLFISVYMFKDNTFMLSMGKDNVPGTFIGFGNNDDFSKPIEAIEIFRLPEWAESEYSYKLIFSPVTSLISTKMTIDGPNSTANVIPCGLEILDPTLCRIQL